MANRVLSIPPAMLPGIAVLVSHQEQLSKLSLMIERLPPARRSIPNITREVAHKLVVPLGDARRLVVALLSFHQLRESFGMSAAEMYDAVSDSLEVDAPEEWRSKNLDGWRSSRSAIEEATSSKHALYFVQKNLRLTYEHANILRDASIVVDTRPLFDEAGREIVQWAVDYTLQVEYYDGDSVKRLNATLDSKDLEKLLSQCERAQVKATTLKEALQPLKRPVIITGEEEQ